MGVAGQQPIDVSYIGEHDNIALTWNVDLITGQCRLDVGVYNSEQQEATNYSVAHIADEVYMAYLYGTSQNGHGRFLKMMNGAYELVWFNCRTAETITETVTVEDGTFTIPNKPDSYDWVIALRFRG